MWILSESNGEKVSGKYQYGQVDHARRRAEKLFGGRLTWENELTEYIGSDRDGKIWYRIIWQETNPVKKDYEVLPVTDVKNNDVLVEHGGLFRVFNRKVSKAHSIDKYGETVYFESEFLGPYKGSVVSIPAHWRTKDRPWIVQGNKLRSAVRIKNKRKVKQLIFENPKLRQKGNTKVSQGSGKELTVRLHDTDIVKILANGDIQLNSGGWLTPTTKRRMNEASDELELYYNVYAKKGEWFVDTRGRNTPDKTFEFFDGVIIPGPGHLKNPISNDLKNFNRVLKEFKGMTKSALMQFWSAHQRGRGSKGLGIRSRNLVNDLANIAANLATAKGTKGDTKKMYEQIAHDIVIDAKRTARKKNPRKKKMKDFYTPNYWQIFKCKGNEVYWLKGFAIDKPRWTLTRGDAARYQYDHQARKIAEYAYKPGWQIGAAEKGSRVADIIKSCKPGKGARRRNPVGPTQREIDQAGELFKDFTGNAPDNLQKVRIRNPKTGLVIGELDGVLYTTVRDGKTEKYKHDFKKGNRPHLVASHDGQSLHILGGDYEFTERGIEG
jgi:hypothetical protein